MYSYNIHLGRFAVLWRDIFDDFKSPPTVVFSIPKMGNVPAEGVASSDPSVLFKPRIAPEPHGNKPAVPAGTIGHLAPVWRYSNPSPQSAWIEKLPLAIWAEPCPEITPLPLQVISAGWVPAYPALMQPVKTEHARRKTTLRSKAMVFPLWLR